LCAIDFDPEPKPSLSLYTRRIVQACGAHLSQLRDKAARATCIDVEAVVKRCNAV